MPVHVALSEFLETGFFGPIELGMQKPEIEDALGPPDSEGGTSQSQREPLIWRYGPFELHFAEDSGQLERISTEDLAVLEGGPRLALDAWALSAKSTRSEVERKLAEAGIGFARTLHPWDERTVELVTGGLVSLLFMAPEEAPEIDPSQYLLGALWRASAPSVVVAEAFDRQEAKRRATEWRTAFPELAKLVPEEGWVLDAYPEDDGRTLYRMRVEFEPEPEAPGHSHH
ncbi:MAG TPA: hypothetical protein VGK67_36770 [Myxococcales bacterium]|jgi:hypothetical protein